MKRILTITAVSLLALSPMYGQDSCRYPQDPTLEKSQAYAGYDCVTLLDSTAVTVQPTGSGAFAVCKAFKVQTSKGAVANRIIKYDYDPLTAHAEFRYATIYRANGDVINLDVTQACDYAAPARAIYWRPADHAGSGPLATGRYRGVRDRQERFHLRLADGG